MTTWFTSDNHFGHRRILQFCPKTRPFQDAAEMDERMIAIWNGMVAPDDDVYMLGDLSWHFPEKTVKILKRLVGNKHLIWGNHDYDAKFDRSQAVRECFVSTDIRIEIVMEGIRVVLDHYPIAEWHGAHRGAFHFHGHTHGNVILPGRALDVGIDGPLGNGDCRLYTWNECKAYCQDRPLPA